MPAKRNLRGKTPPTRVRSKSAGRSESKPRATSRSRSRSRTRATPAPTKKIRQTASETKARRESSSSSSEDMSPVVLRPRKPKTIDDKSKRRQTLLSGDLKQEILQKIEADVDRKESAPNHTKKRIGTSCPTFLGCLCQKFRYLVSESCLTCCSIMLMIPFVYWVNLLIFAQQSGNTTTTVWGPAKLFASVLWPTDWKAYLSLHSFGAVLIFVMLHFVVARFVPIGARIETPSKRGYRCNGFVTLLLIAVLFAAAQWSELPQLKLIRPGSLFPKHLLSIITASTVFSIVLAFATYFASRRAHHTELAQSSVRSAGFFTDFFAGRLLHPQMLGVHWKQLTLRIIVTSILLIDACYVSASFMRFGKVSPALIVMVMMRVVHAVDFFLFERTLQFTYEFNYEPYGFKLICGGLAIYPFLYTIGSAYAFAHPELGWVYRHGVVSYELVYLLYGVSLAIFVVGFYFSRVSNLQKDAFRRQSVMSTRSAVVVGHESHRLLCSGLWGIVRHPNHLGEVMMICAQTIPMGFVSPLPWIAPLLLTAFLLHRTHDAEKACSKKHRAVWTHYTRLVPCKLIPKVY